MLGKFMDNLLYGNDGSDPKILSASEKLNSPINKQMPGKSSLSLTDSDIDPLNYDNLAFAYENYPQEVGQLGDGHYMEFHIFENTKAEIETLDPQSFNAQTTGGETMARQIGDEVVKGTTGLIKGVSKVIETQYENTLNYIKNENVSFSEAFNLDGGYEKIKKYVASSVDLKEYEKTFKDGPRDKFDSTHKILKGSIVLYTPPENKFKYSAEYEGNPTGVLGGLAGADNFLGALPSAGLAGLGNLLGGAADVLSPGASGLLTRGFGVAVNPNLEQAFRSVPFRDFTYNYTFAPKNKQELESVHKIIQTFKFHMLPALTVDEFFMITPSQFQMVYRYRGDGNDYIPRITKCVLKDMEVDYAPGEKFTTLKPDARGASPQIINMQLLFQEMQVLTKESIVAGF